MNEKTKEKMRRIRDYFRKIDPYPLIGSQISVTLDRDFGYTNTLKADPKTGQAEIQCFVKRYENGKANIWKPENPSVRLFVTPFRITSEFCNYFPEKFIRWTRNAGDEFQKLENECFEYLKRNGIIDTPHFGCAVVEHLTELTLLFQVPEVGTITMKTEPFTEDIMSGKPYYSLTDRRRGYQLHCGHYNFRGFDDLALMGQYQIYKALHR